MTGVAQHTCLSNDQMIKALVLAITKITPLNTQYQANGCLLVIQDDHLKEAEIYAVLDQGTKEQLAVITNGKDCVTVNVMASTQDPVLYKKAAKRVRVFLTKVIGIIPLNDFATLLNPVPVTFDKDMT